MDAVKKSIGITSLVEGRGVTVGVNRGNPRIIPIFLKCTQELFLSDFMIKMAHGFVWMNFSRRHVLEL